MGAASSRMGGLAAAPPIDFQRVKNPLVPRKRRTFKHGGGRLVKNAKQDEQLRKLRIPADICRVLPSVKRFKGDGGYIDTTQNDYGKDASIRVSLQNEETSLVKRKCTGNSVPKLSIFSLMVIFRGMLGFLHLPKTFS